MAKTSKATKTTEVTASAAPTPAPTPVVTASASEKTVKAKKPKAVKEAETPAVTAAPASTPTPVVAASSSSSSSDSSTDAPATAEASISEQSIEFLAKLQQMGLLISSLKTEYRALEKKWTRELKASQKQNSRRKRKTGNRAPSGFVKPTRISDELASFLGKDIGTEMARTDVTREINLYIRTNKLQDEKNGRAINPDEKLATLLKIPNSDVLTYFNLQRYMSRHFAKNVKVEATATA